MESDIFLFFFCFQDNVKIPNSRIGLRELVYSYVATCFFYHCLYFWIGEKYILDITKLFYFLELCYCVINNCGFWRLEEVPFVRLTQLCQFLGATTCRFPHDELLNLMIFS